MACFTDLQLRHNLASVAMNSYSYATHSDISQKGPSIKYVTLFWTNFDPPSFCHTSLDLLKFVTHLGPPILSNTCIHRPTCLYRGFVLVRGGFVRGVCLGVFCLEGFVRGGFCPSPSVRIHPLQQKAKHHFQF